MKRVVLCLILLAGLARPAVAAQEFLVAHDAVWPPFEYLDENKKLVGFSVDYIRAVAKEAGFAVVNVHVPWDGIFHSLDQDLVQIIASSVTINDDRRARMDFSAPYFTTRQVLLLPADSTVSGPGDLKGKIIGVQAGTTGQDVINSHDGLTAKLYDDLIDAVDELAEGSLDGAMGDEMVILYFAELERNRGKLKLAEFPLTSVSEQYGFVVRKGNTALLEAVNRGMEAVRKSGRDQAIRQYWFGKDAIGQADNTQGETYGTQ